MSFEKCNLFQRWKRFSKVKLKLSFYYAKLRTAEPQLANLDDDRVLKLTIPEKPKSKYQRYLAVK